MQKDCIRFQLLKTREGPFTDFYNIRKINIKKQRKFYGKWKLLIFSSAELLDMLLLTYITVIMMNP